LTTDMKSIRYTLRRVAQLLEVTPAEVQSAAAGRDVFAPADLAALRAKLGRAPQARAVRRQLFLNFKGGTGKTSVSTSYAYRLAELGHRVLVVDLDSQGHASKCLGVESSEVERTIADALVKKMPMKDIIVPSAMPGLDLAPANLAMATVDVSLMPLPARELRLRNALKEIERGYAFVIMDAPPSFGLVNLDAMLAAHDLIVPVLADFLSFHGLKLLFETVQSLEEDLPLALQNIFVVINAFNASFKIAREARGALEEHYAEHLCGTVIRQCQRFAQASSEGVPVVGFDAECKGAEDIITFTEEILNRLAAAENTPGTKKRGVAG